MSVNNVRGTARQYEVSQGIDRQKTAAADIGFDQHLQNAKAAGKEAYIAYLASKYGSGVTVQNVDLNQKSMDALGAKTAGTGNVVIAPNILEQMAGNPEKAAYYEEKIQYYFDSLPRCEAELSAMGHEIHSSGIVIHPDGTVTHYISGDLKPEVRARIEAQVKAEREEKDNRRKQFQALNAEAAEKRRLLLQQYLEKQLLAQQNRIQGADNIYIVNPPRDFDAFAAYKNAASAFPI